MELKIAQRSNKNWLDSCSFANNRFISSYEAFTRSLVLFSTEDGATIGEAMQNHIVPESQYKNANSSNDSHAKWNRMNAADENIFI